MAPATDNTNTPTVSQDPNSFVNNIVREEIDIGNVPIQELCQSFSSYCQKTKGPSWTPRKDRTKEKKKTRRW